MDPRKIEGIEFTNYCQQLADSWLARAFKQDAERCVTEHPERFEMSCAKFGKIMRPGVLRGGIMLCSLENTSKD